MPRKQKYLNNKDLLKQIHLSKNSFCYYTNKTYENFNIILSDINLINKKNIKIAKINKTKYIKEQTLIESKTIKNKTPIIHNHSCNNIELNEIVFRIMDYNHIPYDLTRKKTHRTEADKRVKLPFHPFKHYAFINNELKEVGRSHWKGNLKTGCFNLNHGRITDELANMYIKLVEHYSTKNNWRGYTYLDEMQGQALVQLSSIGLQFDENKSQNPFAYYTTVINNSFTRVLLIEKKNQDIRDDLYQESGELPSFSRQIKHEEEMRQMRNERNEQKTQ